MLFDHGRTAIRGIVSLLALVAGLAQATEVPPEPFEESVLEETVEISSPGRLVLFSPVREVNNEIRSASLARLPVKGKGQLFRVLNGASREEALNHYLRRLRDRGATVLFECSGVSCGGSSVWANQIFDQSTLFGSNRDQNYVVAGKIDENGKPSLTVIYTVKRTNQREYVWVEQLEAPVGTTIPGLGTGGSRIKGPVLVPWEGGITFSFDWTTTDRRLINEWSSSEGARVVLVSYSELKDDESFGEAMERAENAAESLTRLLTKTGVPESQQERIVVGPAVVIPNPDRQGNRVEVMVIQR
jgi:uncharacterized protein DUF4892